MEYVFTQTLLHVQDVTQRSKAGLNLEFTFSQMDSCLSEELLHEVKYKQDLNSGH